MSATDAGSQAPAGTTAGSAAPAAPNSTGGTSAPAANQPAANAGAPASPGAQTTKPRGAQAAATRAAEKIAARKAATAAQPGAAAPGAPNTSAIKADEQAPGAVSGAGVSTQNAQAGEPPKGDAAGAKPGETPPSGSTVEAPADWPQAMRESFGKLPNEARELVLGFQKNLQAGFTKATTDIKQLREQHQEAIQIGERFAADPKGTIEALAKRAGIQIWTERPLAEGEVPQFKSPAEMAEWASQRAIAAAEAAAEQRRKADEEARQSEEANRKFRTELDTAMKDHPDFLQHRQAVFTHMSRAPGMSVEDGYRLATYEPLLKLAQDAETSRRELARVTAELEDHKKRLTAPPAPGAASATARPEDAHLSPAQRAAKRAQARIAKRGSA